MTNLSGANLNNGAAVGPQGEGMESPSTFPAYPEYKDSKVTWIGDVPTSWEVKPFKWLLSNNDGGVWGDDPTGEGDTLVLRSTDQTVDGNWKLTDPAPRKLSAKEKASALLIEGDLVVTKSSGSSLHIGKATLVTADIAKQGCCYGNFMQRLRVNSGFTPKLAWYVMNNELARAQLDLLSNSTTGLANLNGTLIGEILLPVSTVAEQTQIACFLDHETARIDALIEEQQRLIELLKEKRQVMISHVVTKGLDPTVPMKDSGVKWLGDVPAHWEVLATKRFFRMVVDPAPDDNDFELLSVYTEIGVRPRKDLEQKGNKASTTDGYWRVKKGDLIVNKLLAWMGAVGYSDYDGVTSPAYDILRPSRQLSPKFYHYIFRGKPAQQEFKRWSRGIMEMRLRLYFDELGRISMPFPPPNEQENIVAYIEAMETKFDSLGQAASEQIRYLSERRSALISAAVTGKIDVRGWQPSVSVQAPVLEAEAV